MALDAVLQPASPAAQQAARQEKSAAVLAPAVVEEDLTALQRFERGFGASDIDEQVRLYGEAIRLKPNFAEAFNHRGMALRSKGNPTGALADYNEAIRLKSNLADAYSNRAAVHRANGDLDQALNDYTKAVRLSLEPASALSHKRRVIPRPSGTPS